MLIKALFKECQPKDKLSKVETNQQLLEIKQKDGEDPTKTFDEISIIENSYDDATRHLDSDDLIAYVTSAASEECTTTIATEMRRH